VARLVPGVVHFPGRRRGGFVRVSGRNVVASGVLVLVAGAALVGCGSGGGGGEASPSATSFDTLATTALVTKQEVTAIAGEGFEPYDSEATASAADPAECLELLRLARLRRRRHGVLGDPLDARGSTGASITNTVHVLVDDAKADEVYDHLASLVPTCKDFTVVVGSGVLKASIVKAKTASAGERSLGLRVVITSPTQKSDVTTVVAQQGRTLVVGVAGTPDGADEADWAAQTAQVSAQKAASIT
jgi:hypothetical protein